MKVSDPESQPNKILCNNDYNPVRRGIIENCVDTDCMIHIYSYLILIEIQEDYMFRE